jgi:hypothetical protein
VEVANVFDDRGLVCILVNVAESVVIAVAVAVIVMIVDIRGRGGRESSDRSKNRDMTPEQWFEIIIP